MTITMTLERNMDHAKVSRRDFAKSAAAATALAVPYFVPSSVVGAAAPSNRINVACVGVGNQGSPNVLRFLKQSDCQVVAVCDVNRGSYGYKEPDDFYGREPAKKIGACGGSSSRSCWRSSHWNLEWHPL